VTREIKVYYNFIRDATRRFAEIVSLLVRLFFSIIEMDEGNYRILQMFIRRHKRRDLTFLIQELTDNFVISQEYRRASILINVHRWSIGSSQRYDDQTSTHAIAIRFIVRMYGHQQPSIRTYLKQTERRKEVSILHVSMNSWVEMHTSNATPDKVRYPYQVQVRVTEPHSSMFTRQIDRALKRE
jgi:hypothetical protein